MSVIELKYCAEHTVVQEAAEYKLVQLPIGMQAVQPIIRFPAGVHATVRPYVQAFSDACEETTGESNFGTYPGHDPDIDLALDCFVPVDSDVLGNKICNFALSHMKDFGIWYVIYRQHIYNPLIADYWRPMADRGDLTQNHFDHVHISFLDSFKYSGKVIPPVDTSEEDFDDLIILAA